MLFQLFLFIVVFVAGIGTGAWINKIVAQWMAENKEPSPDLVRDRKELLSTAFVFTCIAILILGITTKDRSGGLALIAVSVIPVLFLCFELLAPRNKDEVRGHNALGYFILNVVLYGGVRALNGFPGIFESLNSVTSVSFLLVMFVIFLVDVCCSGMLFLLSTDSPETKESYMRALPVYAKTYALMLTIFGISLIVSR